MVFYSSTVGQSLRYHKYFYAMPPRISLSDKRLGHLAESFWTGHFSVVHEANIQYNKYNFDLYRFEFVWQTLSCILIYSNILRECGITIKQFVKLQLNTVQS